MDGQHWERVERVLDLALESDPTRWQVVLDESCSGDAVLRQDVESLLRRYSTARWYLASPPVAAAAALVAEAREKEAKHDLAGRRIGAWRVVKQIGRGGMARVYLAERADGQYTQQVALKLLRPGLDAELDHRRFRAERQIVASLGHPNIARLLDGGVTDDGTPYLALEYVEGEPIDRYCATRGLAVRQRLELFLVVADATQYAHRNLIVHRDLKPSNIHVTADAQVKLLDFGLAKLLDAGDDRLTRPATVTGQRWMTPEYAAPEQIRGTAVTTVTDVYQLGAVLYEMLTGGVPFGVRTGGVRALEDAILDTDPPVPSSMVPAGPTRRALAGDLDAIVLKALQKEPEQRYASADAMADDLRRHLAGHPVVARERRTGYLVRRFARRHQWGIAAAAGFVVLLGAYAATVTVQAGRIQRALDQARTETRKSEQITKFMLGLFEANDPGRSLGDTITARELMDRGAAQAQLLAAQPAVQAQMLDVIGQIRMELGAFAGARTTLEQALGARRRALGDRHPDVATSYANLGYVAQREGQLDSSIVLLRRALEMRRELLGPTHPQTREALFALATSVHQKGDFATARPLFDEWMAARGRARAEPNADEADQLTAIAMLSLFSGQVARADTLIREALAIRRFVYGDRHPAVASSLGSLSSVQLRLGKLPESTRLAREAVVVQRAVYPDGHPELATALANFGSSLRAEKQLDSAEHVFRESIEMNRRFVGEDGTMVGPTMGLLARVLHEKGNEDEAERMYREVLRLSRRQFPEKNLFILQTRVSLGEVLRAKRSYAEAERELTETFVILRDSRGLVHAATKRAISALAELYEASGRQAEAATYRAMLAGR